MDQTVPVYRAVCEAEYLQWQKTHTFEVIPGALDGKWFALRRPDAVLWGRWFASKTAVPHDRIIAVQMPMELYERFEPKIQKLDGIGPACFAPIELLRGMKFEEVQE